MFHVKGGRKMSKIVFLAPDEYMYDTACSVAADADYRIRVEKGLLSEGVAVARRLAEQGAEIFITRGGTAALIKEAGIEVSIVEVPITGFDIIRTVEQAKRQGSHIAVVAFSSMVLGVECLGPILGVDIRKYIIFNEFEAEGKIRQAFQEGADVVIGGVITTKAARKHHLPCVLISSGREGIVQAIKEAQRLAEARRLEKVKASLFRTVLDYAYEGIITVDSEARITIFNPVAQRLTKLNGAKTAGQPIGKVWPELRLERVVATGRDDLGQVLKINGTQVLCNKVPIIVNEKIAGAVATFQDVSRIQQMEAKIRQEIYASGHIASLAFEDILGSSPSIRNTIRIAREYAQTESAVLILGETGTGKEIFAQSIHNYSHRSRGPFVAVNCAALPSQILESELFGYVGGAFTGANREGKPGLFEVAHRGTILLDEIAEMDYVTQGKLLRVLQEKKVVRLGSDRVIPVDVRIIAATNKNLKQLVSQHRFRADLYYRLNVLRLHLPPLRDRDSDIKIYARRFLEKQAQTMKRHLRFTPAALELLSKYPWPGNVRELQNVIERIVAVCHSGEIDAGITAQMLQDDQEGDNLSAMIVSSEVDDIKKAVAEAKGKYTDAAKILGVSRSTLWRRMRALGLK
jgi:transcriptional regulator with PAS, ATPase and Fis domain